MSGTYTSSSNLVYEKSDDRCKCLCCITVIPETFSDTITDFNRLNSLVNLNYTYASDGLLEIIKLNSPLVKIFLVILSYPVFYDSLCNINALMCRPCKIFCHFRVICPVVKHVFRIFYFKSSKSKPFSGDFSCS